MRFISCHDGKLQSLTTAGLKTSPERAFVTGLLAWDAIAPQRMFARGAVHELLFDAAAGQPRFVAAVMAQGAGKAKDEGGRMKDETEGGSSSSSFILPPSSLSCPIVWSDPRGEVYPPALAALGFDLTKMFLLRTSRDEEEAWAVAECLRCRGVGAVIAAPTPARKMSRIEARRLQLAAEHGGSVGILLRQTGRGDDVYAAATRWKVSPMPGERTVQRWTIQLLHGHGGLVGNTVILEWRRETNSVHTAEQLADRPAAETAAAERRRRATA
jgi:hypothetical protein